ncbi:hypothetical protein OEZ71_06330 [Defluviimonas sp. WL0050]|uniref:CENP-V/GFA domain-containing protein n=1 Tax=Albidovulum litorale TaxID=2984134 RepID=A0ABT2ZLB6_9RHOB|nr:hypothetical protein [Defluviimonas sp. WL0050]MCV2871909.1 hypothetical protein [Defluviimonas sp. WL0050]
MEHQATHVTGGCLCGNIRYEADVFLHDGYICHCTICQRSTGQPAEITVLIKAGTQVSERRTKILCVLGYGKTRVLRELRLSHRMAGIGGRG